MSQPRRLAQLLKAGEPPLQRAIAHGRQLARIEHALVALLPVGARDHCRVAGIEGARLLLYAGNAAWAARLRYQVPAMLPHLQRIHPLQRVTVKVRPTHWTPPPRKRATPLSAESAATIRATAEGITDPKLRAALERLARRATTDA